MNEGTPQPTFTREQKIGFVLLLVFALVTLGMGALQIRNTVYGPFIVHETATANAALDDKIRLQQLDTDHDGLSDYDEINLYGTSPYLPDTDSDGIPDKQEVQNGTDPLCPEGQVCAAGENVASSTAPSFRLPGVGDGNIVTGVLAPATTTVSGANLQNIIHDPVALRQLLLSSGSISQSDLDAIPDNELLQFADQLFREQASSLATSTRSAVTSSQR